MKTFEKKFCEFCDAVNAFQDWNPQYYDMTKINSSTLICIPFVTKGLSTVFNFHPN